MVRASKRPSAVAAANPTTARIHTALELLLNIDGLHDLPIRVDHIIIIIIIILGLG